jgi:hypothetical protein
VLPHITVPGAGLGVYGQAWYLTNDLPISIYMSINYISLPGAGLGVYGQAWYVNGDLAPDLFLVKGQKYTFIVEVRHTDKKRKSNFPCK